MSWFRTLKRRVDEGRDPPARSKLVFENWKPIPMPIPEPIDDMTRRIVREELTRWFGPPPQE